MKTFPALKEPKLSFRAGLGQTATPGRPLIWRPGQVNNSTPIVWTFSTYNRAGKWFWGCMPKMLILLREIILHVKNLRLPVPYFWLFQQCL